MATTCDTILAISTRACVIPMLLQLQPRLRARFNECEIAVMMTDVASELTGEMERMEVGGGGGFAC